MIDRGEAEGRRDDRVGVEARRGRGAGRADPRPCRRAPATAQRRAANRPRRARAEAHGEARARAGRGSAARVQCRAGDCSERQRAVIRRVAECERAAGYVGTNRAKKTAWDNARYQGLGGKNYLKGGKRGKAWQKEIENGSEGAEEEDGGAMVERGNETVNDGVGGNGGWYAGKTDEEIVADTVSWLAREMRGMMIYRDYREIYDRALAILEKWRRSFPKSVWIRVVKSGRIAKELASARPSSSTRWTAWQKCRCRRTRTSGRRSSTCAAGSDTSACFSPRCSTRGR